MSLAAFALLRLRPSGIATLKSISSEKRRMRPQALESDVPPPKAGIAPPGTDSRELTAVLLWATERSLYVAGLDAGSPLPSEERSVPALYAVWRGAIYGADAEIASL